MERRSTFWTRTFEAARAAGGWYRVDRYYTRSTAAQIASDIACAHRRRADAQRVRGILPGEQWQARWERADDGPPEDHVVWIRLVAAAPEAS